MGHQSFLVTFFTILSIFFSLHPTKELFDALQTNDLELFVTALCHSINDIYVPDEEGNTILHCACLKKDVTMYLVNLILNHEGLYYWENEPLSEKINNQGLTPFSCAVLNFHSINFLTELAEKMQSTGFNINYKNKDGNTVLHLFIKKYSDSLWCENEFAMLSLLKKLGCSITTRNRKEQTPLDLIKDPQTKILVHDLWNKKCSNNNKNAIRKNTFIRLCPCLLT